MREIKRKKEGYPSLLAFKMSFVLALSFSLPFKGFQADLHQRITVLEAPSTSSNLKDSDVLAPAEEETEESKKTAKRILTVLSFDQILIQPSQTAHFDFSFPNPPLFHSFDSPSRAPPQIS